MTVLGMFELSISYIFRGEKYEGSSGYLPLEYETDTPVMDQYSWETIALGMVLSTIGEYEEYEYENIYESIEAEVRQDPATITSLN